MIEKEKQNVEKKTKVDIYKEWLDERKKVIFEITQGNPNFFKDTKAAIEKAVDELHNRKLQPGEKRYFSITDYMNIPEIANHFNIPIFVGPRNIGKTTALKKYLETRPGRGMVMRQQQNEALEFLDTENYAGFGDNGGETDNRDIGTVRYIQEKGDKGPSEIVGGVKDLKTSAKFKSIEFPELRTIYFDEFMSDIKVKDPADKLVDFIITAQRQRADFQLVLTANVTDKSNELLSLLAIGYDENTSVTMNFLTGAIFINIPNGVYYQFKNTASLGYRIALENKDKHYKQFGNKLKTTSEMNILPKDDEYIKGSMNGHFMYIGAIDEKTQLIITYMENVNAYYIDQVSPYDEIDGLQIVSLSTEYITHFHTGFVVDILFFKSFIHQGLNNRVFVKQYALRDKIAIMISALLKGIIKE